MRIQHIGAVAALAAACAVSACTRDAHAPAIGQDEWADMTLAGLEMRQTLTTFEPGQPPRTWSRVGRFPQTGAFTRASDGEQFRGRSGVIQRHYRDKDGRTQTVALRYEGRGEPAKGIYVFEDGKIRAVVSPKYVRRGDAFERRAMRITFFDSTGVPTRQLTLEANSRGAFVPSVPLPGSRFRELARDALALVLPATLHAEEIPSACTSEWVSYGAASFGLAAANTALTASILGCPATAGAACATFEVAFVAWTVAVAKWSEALDKLAKCIELNKKKPGDEEVTDPNNLGGDGGGGGGGLTEEELERERAALEDTVDEFINLSIASGNYWCNESGDYCVYYGMT
jgi:hypothetical protein